MLNGRALFAGCGTTNDALAFAGYTGAAINTTELYNGSI